MGAAVISVFVWAIVIESIVGGLFTSVRPYLPYTAATTLGGTQVGGAAFGPAHGLSGSGPLPFLAAAALVAGVTAGTWDPLIDVQVPAGAVAGQYTATITQSAA